MKCLLILIRQYVLIAVEGYVLRELLIVRNVVRRQFLVPDGVGQGGMMD